MKTKLSRKSPTEGFFLSGNNFPVFLQTPR
nr:MAG TPA: hypothetical protein [Bacteriophage sp.]